MSTLVAVAAGAGTAAVWFALVQGRLVSGGPVSAVLGISLAVNVVLLVLLARRPRA